MTDCIISVNRILVLSAKSTILERFQITGVGNGDEFANMSMNYIQYGALNFTEIVSINW